jgi:hypothetical protein
MNAKSHALYLQPKPIHKKSRNAGRFSAYNTPGANAFTKIH